MEITKIDPSGSINATNYNVIFGADCQLINFYKKREFIDSESFLILRSFLSWYCKDSCIYRHTPPPLFWSIILFKTIMSHIVVNMIWFYPSFR